MELKRCIICREFKNLNEFYPHPQMQNGVDSKCKKCVKDYAQNIKKSEKLVWMSKTWSNCGETKPTSEFYKHAYSSDGYFSHCKSCDRKRNESKKTKEKIKVTHKKCGKCGIEKPVSDFNKLATSIDGYNYSCRKCRSEYLGTEQQKKVRNTKTQLRIKEDPIFRFHCRLRSALSSSIGKNAKRNKNKPWISYIGYTIQDLINHIEPKFKEGMSWANYGLGGWALDHIIPIRFKNPDGSYYWNQEELSDPSTETFKKCWALDNLQPLWCDENTSKGNRFLG